LVSSPGGLKGCAEPPGGYGDGYFHALSCGGGCLHLTVFIQFVRLGFPGQRGRLYQWIISRHATVQFSAVLFLLPISPALPPLATSEASSWGLFALLVLAYGLALLGLRQSVTWRWEDVHVKLAPEGPLPTFPAREKPLQPAEVPAGKPPLRIIQITDPHIGPFVTVGALRRMCAEAVARAPDLVLLTGDFYTVEGHKEGMLREALAPLRDLPGRCFACLGNHDKESEEVLDMTTRDLAECGVQLLVDEARDVSLPGGVRVGLRTSGLIRSQGLLVDEGGSSTCAFG